MRSAIIILLFSLSIPSIAQKDRVRDRIKSQRIAFITDRLSLSSEEAQKFWPVYNQFTDELESIKREMNKLRRSTNDNLKNLSEKEIEKALEDDIISQQKMTDVHRRFQAELKKVVTVRKIAQLYKAEHDFKLTLLKRVGEKGRQGHPPPPPEDEL